MENPSAEAENETLAAAAAARERKKEKFVEQQLQWADGERGRGTAAAGGRVAFGSLQVGFEA